MSKCRYDLSKDCSNTDCLRCVIDQIEVEIETDLSHFCFDAWGNETLVWKEIKAIIDKYKAESEDKKEELKCCDRSICVSNEHSGIGCDECTVNIRDDGGR